MGISWLNLAPSPELGSKQDLEDLPGCDVFSHRIVSNGNSSLVILDFLMVN